MCVLSPFYFIPHILISPFNKTLVFHWRVNLAHAENGLHPPVIRSSILLFPQIREFKVAY